MTTQVFLFAVIVLCGCSAAASASGPNQKKEGSSIKVHKEHKNKDKDKKGTNGQTLRRQGTNEQTLRQAGAVAVPDGDPSAALLLTLGAGTVGVALALARLSERKPRQPVS